jgi:hemoglobin
MRAIVRMSLVVVIGALPLAACSRGEQAADTTAAAAAKADSAAPKTLYDRLGGKDAITAVVDSFVAKVAADTRINKKFAKSDVGRVKTMLVDQICAATGGPCTYTGRSMKDAHRNLAVSEGEFNALVEDLTATLNGFKVGLIEQNELLAALGSMKADIVEVQGTATGTALPKAFVPAKADSAKK